MNDEPEMKKVNPHLWEGTFRSDKYAWCPPGFVPLKVTDPMAVDLLMMYAIRRREVDEDFSSALSEVLRRGGFPEEEFRSFMESVDLVVRERIRQETEEGWTAEHDDGHTHGEMATAAGAYCESANRDRDAEGEISREDLEFLEQEHWPIQWDASWLKPKTPERDLIRAGALILAELDRRRRLREKPETRSIKYLRELNIHEVMTFLGEEGRKKLRYDAGSNEYYLDETLLRAGDLITREASGTFLVVGVDGGAS